MTTAALRRMERIYRKTSKDGIHIDGKLAAEMMWRSLSLDDRQLVLEQAGWDSGGWIFRNWHELAPELQKDFSQRMSQLIERKELPSGKRISEEEWSSA